MWLLNEFSANVVDRKLLEQNVIGAKEFRNAQHRPGRKKEKERSKGDKARSFQTVCNDDDQFCECRRFEPPLPNQHCRERNLREFIEIRVHMLPLKTCSSIITFSHMKKFSTYRNFTLDSLINYLVTFICHVLFYIYTKSLMRRFFRKSANLSSAT